MGKSKEKPKLLKRVNQELGTEFKAATVKGWAVALEKLSATSISEAESKKVSLSSWRKIFDGVEEPEDFEKLAGMATSGATVEECRSAVQIKPKAKRSKKSSPPVTPPAPATFPEVVFDRCFALSLPYGLAEKLSALLALAIAIEEVEQAFVVETVSTPDEVESEFSLALEVVEVQPERPESIELELWQQFTVYERKQAIRLLAGETVVCAMHNFSKPYTAFIIWAKANGGFVKVDRTNKTYGNPFKVGEDGTLPEVIEFHKRMVLNNSQLLNRIPVELKGKALGCWCKKKDGSAPCHADLLAAIADGEQF